MVTQEGLAHGLAGPPPQLLQLDRWALLTEPTGTSPPLSPALHISNGRETPCHLGWANAKGSQQKSHASLGSTFLLPAITGRWWPLVFCVTETWPVTDFLPDPELSLRAASCLRRGNSPFFVLVTACDGCHLVVWIFLKKETI